MTAAPANAQVSSARTEDLTPDLRAAIVALCIAAHREPDFNHLFTYIPSGGRHFLAYAGDRLVSHAVVTTRWLWLEALRRLRTAYVDAVATPTGVGADAGGHLGRERHSPQLTTPPPGLSYWPQ
jgi:hypothetical protein